MRRACFSTAIAAMASLAFAGPASAQTAGRFSDLQKLVKVNDMIEVAADTGVLITARVVSLTPSSVTVLLPADRKNGFPAEKITFADTSVGRIRGVDPIWDVAAIGAIAGVVPGSVVGSWACGEGASGTCLRNGLIGALIFGGIGFGIGAGIDMSLRETLYDATRRKATVAVAPVMGSGRRGVNVAIRF